MKRSPFEWRRGPRSAFSLGHDAGVYALFLRKGSALPGAEPGEQGLLYIGLAANHHGLKGRCHFDARTRNHSPRKSLAVLLMDVLRLTPVLITKPNSADTWGLDSSSDARLSAWMHDHLDLAIEICADPESRETELLGRYTPPLNLSKCAQTTQHRLISAARTEVMSRLQGQQAQPLEAKSRHGRKDRKSPSMSAAGASAPFQPPCHSARHFAGADMDTAEAVAGRYGLNPKSYRQRLRVSIAWYRKPQHWTFPVGSDEWRDMIRVAERMAR